MEKKITIEPDGNLYCAYRDGFQNLQESDAGFGISPIDALMDLLKIEGKVDPMAAAFTSRPFMAATRSRV